MYSKNGENIITAKMTELILAILQNAEIHVPVHCTGHLIKMWHQRGRYT